MVALRCEKNFLVILVNNSEAILLHIRPPRFTSVLIVDLKGLKRLDVQDMP